LIENCAVSQQVQVRYGLKATEITALPQTRWADSVEKVPNLKSLQICQNTIGIFD